MKHDLINKYFSNCKKLNYEKGEYVIRPGVKNNMIFLIENGFVKLFTEDNVFGNEQIVLFYDEGDIFPLCNVFNEYMPHIYIQCITESEVRCVDRIKFESFILSEPSAQKELYNYSCEIIKKLVLRIQNLSLPTASTKLLFRLLYLTKYYGKHKDGVISIEVPVSQNEIANTISISRETANREYEKLSKLGIIDYYNKSIIVKDLKQLINLLEKKTDTSWF